MGQRVLPSGIGGTYVRRGEKKKKKKKRGKKTTGRAAIRPIRNPYAALPMRNVDGYFRRNGTSFEPYGKKKKYR